MLKNTTSKLKHYEQPYKLETYAWQVLRELHAIEKAVIFSVFSNAASPISCLQFDSVSDIQSNCTLEEMERS